MSSEDAPFTVDGTTPHPARRYDYWLGGKDNFQVDRDAADAIEKHFPTVRLLARENRWFLHRGVRFAARELGIRQFLDIGTGIPTSPNTHQVAQEIDPAARIVYVDNDPLVLTHARALLTGTPQGRTAYIDADLREPRKILDHADTVAALDLTQPVALIMLAVLHFIKDEENPRAIIDTLAALFARPDLRLVAPVTSISQWWPEDAPQPRPSVADVAMNGLVARVVRR